MATHFYDPFPKYLQIRGLIVHWLRSLKVGDKLPAEESLALRFNVSRETIREAIGPLQEDGTIGRRPRTGTWLAKELPEAADERLTGPFEGIASLAGLNIEIAQIGQGMVQAPPDIAAILRLPEGAVAYEIKRLRSYEGKPWVALEAFFLPDAGRKIGRLDPTAGFFVQALRQLVDPDVYEQYQHIEALAASAETARILAIETNIPVLLVKRIFVDGRGKPVAVFKSYFRTDRYFYTVNLPKPRAQADRLKPPATRKNRPSAKPQAARRGKPRR
jgi:GntR family transcriptional regulator